MPRTLALLVLVLTGLAVLILPGSTAPNSSLVPSGVEPPGPLVWSDEFDGPAGTAPDQQKWVHDVGGNGWGNGELQFYTEDGTNAALDGEGNLMITARQEQAAGRSCHYGPCRYTSARLSTADRFSQAYGRFEARLKVPAGRGLWPAFWMLGENLNRDGWPLSGEIDVMENVGSEPRTVWASLHGPGYSRDQAVTGSYSLPERQQLSDGFHVFAVDWAPDSITWYVDGKATFRTTRADVPGPWVFDHEFFLILNLAVGGSWPGAPDAATDFPQALLVDYVRVYAPPSEAHPPSGIFLRGVAGRCISTLQPPTPGTVLSMGPCESTLALKWTFLPDGTARSSGLCLQADGISSASTVVDNGVRLRLEACAGGPGQQFLLTPAGDVVNPRSGKCADVALPAGGQPWLQLWDCAGTANQRWTSTTTAL